MLLSFTGYAAADSAMFDKGTVVTRVPENSTIEDYRNNNDFDYDTKLETDLSWWEKIKQLFKKLLGFDEISESSWLIARVIFWILIAGTVAAVIYFVFKNEIRVFFARKNATTGLKTTFLNLEADVDTLDTLLKEAIAQKNYTEAMRLLYTLALKNLAEGGHIILRIDKTNNEYLFELPQGGLQNPFKQLTFYFDYIFYGKFAATESLFLKMQENYSHLSQVLKKIPTR
jgi:hypothetical protein